jgi:hypothetical protein
MLRSSNGYFLVDALVGLSVFIFVLSSMAPVLYKVYQEKQAITQERFAIEVLHNHLQMWLDGELLDEEETVINNGNTSYHLGVIQYGTSVKLCVSWKSANRRLYEMCGNAK